MAWLIIGFLGVDVMLIIIFLAIALYGARSAFKIQLIILSYRLPQTDLTSVVISNILVLL